MRSGRLPAELIAAARERQENDGWDEHAGGVVRRLTTADPRQIGPYRVLAELGQGELGRSLLGRGPDGRLVAIKKVHSPLAEDEEFRARLRQAVAASHAITGVGVGVVPVSDADPDAQIPWLATEFVPAPALYEVVKAIGPLPPQAVLRVAAGLSAALVDIHRTGCPHTALTPSNVLLAADGPRVTDAYIARALESVGGRSVTHVDGLARSAGFLSPEHVAGHEPTPASDVFSLGCVLVMAATGDSPFAASSLPQVLHNIVHAEPDLAVVPEQLRGIVESCLAKDPVERPTASRLLELLQSTTVDTQAWPPGVRDVIEARQAEAAWYVDTGDQRSGDGQSPADQPLPGWPRRLLSAVGSLPGRRKAFITAAIVAVVVASGLVWWLWPESGPHVVPGTVQATVLTADEVSTLLGVTVQASGGSSEPPARLAALPESCAVAVGPATQAVYGREWTVFGSVTYQDSEAVAERAVIQVIGVYPDGDKARTAFRTLTDGVTGCPSAVRTDEDQNNSKWDYKADISTSDRLSWTATQQAGDGWSCYRQARLKGAAVLQVAVCQAGDGKPAAAKIIDQFADNVSG